MSKSVFQSGTTWLRADFHLHTRQDREFTYEGDESRFVSEYVSALDEGGIQVGVVTNHNKFNLGEFKALRGAARKKEIFLLPGVELSVGDGANGVHCLVVFSDTWLDGGDHINQFLTTAFAGKLPEQYEHENGRTEGNLLQTLGMLEHHEKDFFVVFAHVEQASGLWNELKGGRLQELGSNETFRRRCLGFQKVRTRDERTKVQGWLKDAYPAEVEGCDGKNLARIRKAKDDPHKTFLKIGAFHFDAVKFALRDHKHRVRNELPQFKHSFIKSATFEGGMFAGATIHFSPELNTLIGIRGSGKSSILEALRYALDIPLGDRAADEEYKKKLVTHVLGSGGKVTLGVVDRHGQNYELRRILKEQAEVLMGGKLQPGVSIRETVLHRPIYFGQKDLSKSGEGFEQSLIDKLVGPRLMTLRESIEEQRQQVRNAISQLDKANQGADLYAESVDKKRDAEHQLAVYKKYGIADKLDHQVSFDKDLRRVGQTIEAFENYLAASGAVVVDYEDDLRQQPIHQSKYNSAFFEEFFSIYQKSITSLTAHQESIAVGNQALLELKEKSKSLDKVRDGLKEEFAQLERRVAEELKQEGATVRLDEFKQVQAKLTQAERTLDTLGNHQEQRNQANQRLVESLSQLNELWHREFLDIKQELDRINRAESPLQIKADFKGDKKSALAYVKSLFRGSGLREALLEKLLEEYNDFGAMFSQLSEIRDKAGGSANILEEQVRKNLAELLTYQVPNRFTIEYHGKELQQHSLGQRASALILFILAQEENDVIIIDQPEDDLDNQTIYEDVIKLVCRLKSGHQFIFATHNPNVPVLGDAEQVLVCRVEDDKAQVLEGGLDDPSQQAQIVSIMEGGREALSRRQKRYEQWNRQNS